MNKLCAVHTEDYAYKSIIGTGGIGSGMFFLLEQNHTLGRNESRLGALLPFKDYCKQHIILHYIATLLGAPGRFDVHPVGKVGDDETGKSLVEQMRSTGMDMAGVKVIPGYSTLFSVCFQYPDKTGGNITTGNSASSLMTAGDIDEYFSGADHSGKEIVLSVPEVPLDARIRLLEHGRKRKSLNIASLLSGEVAAFREQGGFALTDILSINIDEAESISNLSVTNVSKTEVIEQCVQVLYSENPSISVLVTDGPGGVYAFTGNDIFHQPAYRVDAISTAGAGDAFLSGTICGLCCGLSLHADPEPDAISLGNLLAAYAVTSPDTIHPSANANVLRSFSESTDTGKRFAALFRQVNECSL
ncbi:MAG: hypothetical protein KF746_20655 [Chitinophagaceae bacterium]|nr:hypothetical protein [Chitinophagaceae bacterium]